MCLQEEPKTNESSIHSWFWESIISSALIAEIDDRVKLKPVESSLTEFNSVESYKAQPSLSDTCLSLQAIIKNYNKLHIFFNIPLLNNIQLFVKNVSRKEDGGNKQRITPATVWEGINIKKATTYMFHFM